DPRLLERGPVLAPACARARDQTCPGRRAATDPLGAPRALRLEALERPHIWRVAMHQGLVALGRVVALVEVVDLHTLEQRNGELANLVGGPIVDLQPPPT